MEPLPTWRVEFLGTDEFTADREATEDVQAVNPIEAIKAVNERWGLEVGDAGANERYRVFEITFRPVRTFQVTDTGGIHETTERA